MLFWTGFKNNTLQKVHIAIYQYCNRMYWYHIVTSLLQYINMLIYCTPYFHLHFSSICPSWCWGHPIRAFCVPSSLSSTDPATSPILFLCNSPVCPAPSPSAPLRVPAQQGTPGRFSPPLVAHSESVWSRRWFLKCTGHIPLFCLDLFIRPPNRSSRQKEVFNMSTDR